MAITHPWPNEAGTARRASIAEVRAALGYFPPRFHTLNDFEAKETIGKGRRVPYKAADVLKARQEDLDAIDLYLLRTGAAVSAWIERYASGAPNAIKDEAMIRACSWLADSMGPSINADAPDEGQEMQMSSQSGWARHSGAMSLLSPWRVRRAGVIG